MRNPQTHQHSKLLKFVWMLFAFFMLSGCEKELYEDSLTNNQPKMIVKSINLKKYPSKPQDIISFEKKIEQKNKKLAEGRLVYDSINNFYIDEENTKYIQMGDKESYTVSIKNENIPEIQNLLFNKRADGSYDIYLVKYEYTPEELKSFTQSEINEKKTQFIPVEFDDNGLMTERTAMGGWTCYNVYSVETEYGYMDQIIWQGWTLVSVVCSIDHEDSGGGPTTPVSNPGNNENPTPGSGTNPNNPNNTNTTGGVYGNGGTDGTGIITTPIPPKKTEKEIKLAFQATLSTAQLSWWNNQVNSNSVAQIVSYLTVNQVHDIEENPNEFAIQIIDLSIQEPNQSDVNSLANLSLLLKSNENNIFTDEFELSLDPYVDLNLAELQSNNPPLLSIEIYLKYRKLRQLNPEWTKAKCFWEASKDIIHISLDAFGLVPVVGEIADLTNGLLYTIEGDGLNATLSVVSAVPLVGYGSIGTKYTLKITNQINDINSKVKLVWKATSNGLSFGSRSQLRKVLGLTVGDPRQAHHIIPWNKQSKKIVQKAAESNNAFHMNEALNGIPLNTTVHNGSHSTYDNIIEQKFINFREQNPNATPQECYNFLVDLIHDIRTWILNNPTSHINNLVLP